MARWPLFAFVLSPLRPGSASSQIGIAVGGRVVDAASEQPIGQALVLAISKTGDTLFYSQTNDTGLYFIPNRSHPPATASRWRRWGSPGRSERF